MLLAAMLAMVLAAAVPAFAQEVEGDDNIVNSPFCNQVQNVQVIQSQYGDSFASADDESQAIAVAANELGVEQSQVLNCFVGDNFGENTQGGAIDDSVGVVEVDDEGSASASAVADDDDATVVQYDDDAAVVQYQYDDGSASASASVVADDDVVVLPETGGASLLALGAGALLVAGGLLARRLVR